MSKKEKTENRQHIAFKFRQNFPMNCQQWLILSAIWEYRKKMVKHRYVFILRHKAETLTVKIEQVESLSLLLFQRKMDGMIFCQVSLRLQQKQNRRYQMKKHLKYSMPIHHRKNRLSKHYLTCVKNTAMKYRITEKN